MIANALLVASLFFLALVFWLMQELSFLIPYKSLLVHRYGTALLVFSGALFVNLFALVLAVTRALFLKDTGRKLVHLEKQLRSGGSISNELAERLKD
jgi:hypothetical protein